MLTLRGTAFKTAISHRAGDTNSEGVNARDECGSRARLTSAADEVGHACPLLANQCPRRVSSRLHPAQNKTDPSLSFVSYLTASVLDPASHRAEVPATASTSSRDPPSSVATAHRRLAVASTGAVLTTPSFPRPPPQPPPSAATPRFEAPSVPERPSDPLLYTAATP